MKKKRKKKSSIMSYYNAHFFEKECTCQHCNGLHNAHFFYDNIIMTCICKFIVIVCVFLNVCPNIHAHTTTNIAYM